MMPNALIRRPRIPTMANYSHLIEKYRRIAKQADELNVPKFSETVRDVVETLRKMERFG